MVPQPAQSVKRQRAVRWAGTSIAYNFLEVADGGTTFCFSQSPTTPTIESSPADRRPPDAPWRDDKHRSARTHRGHEPERTTGFRKWSSASEWRHLALMRQERTLKPFSGGYPLQAINRQSVSLAKLALSDRLVPSSAHSPYLCLAGRAFVYYIVDPAKNLRSPHREAIPFSPRGGLRSGGRRAERVDSAPSMKIVPCP